MPNVFNISQLNPLKPYQQSDLLGLGGFTQVALKSFDPNQNERGIDSDFFIRNIKSYMDVVQYSQPYQQGDKITLQWLGWDDYAIGPTVAYVVRLLDYNGDVVKQQNATLGVEIGTGTGVFIREIDMLLYDVPEGKYFPQIHKVGLFTDYDFFLIFEPIEVKTYWPNTMLIRYSHTSNAYGIYFETGIELWKRVFANFTEINPGSVFNVYPDQPQNLTLLSGVKYRDKQLSVGVDNNPNPEFEIDKLEEVFLCDTIYIDHIQHTRNEGSKFEMGRVDKSPVVTANISLRETFSDTDIVVSEYEPIVLGSAPDSDWFYIRVISQTTPATSYPVGLYFNGPENFVNWLNGSNFLGIVDFVNTYFAIDSYGRIVLITNDQTIYDLYSPGLAFATPYTRHLIIDINSNFGTDLQIDLNSAASTKYAYFWGDGTAKTTGSGTLVSTSHTYPPGGHYTAYLFWDEFQSLRLDSSEAIITSLDGKLSNICTYFDVGGMPIKSVKNNIFEHCSNTLANVKFDFCKLNPFKINDLIRFAYESKLTGAFSGSAVLTLSWQTPPAPPSNDYGINFMLNHLAAAGVTVVTD